MNPQLVITPQQRSSNGDDFVQQIIVIYCHVLQMYQAE